MSSSGLAWARCRTVTFGRACPNMMRPKKSGGVRYDFEGTKAVGRPKSGPQDGMLAECSRELGSERTQSQMRQRVTEMARAGIQPARFASPSRYRWSLSDFVKQPRHTRLIGFSARRGDANSPLGTEHTVAQPSCRPCAPADNLVRRSRTETGEPRGLNSRHG
jgi:hypothetical protein